MKIRNKIVLIVGILTLILFSSGITYSIFTSGASIGVNQRIAKFIFNAEKLDHLELSLVDLNPGDSDEYAFSVSNNTEDSLSNVTLEYQIVIKTMHLIPLNIELYKEDNNEFTKVMTCDETYSRNDRNEIVCNSSVQEMAYTNEALDNYKLKVDFPSNYIDDAYSNLVDYLDLEIKSWQKIS